MMWPSATSSTIGIFLVVLMMMTIQTACSWSTPATSNKAAEQAKIHAVFTEDGSLKYLPKLVVLDLDNTLWTPELYQIRQSTTPRANVDIHLFPEARVILEYLAKCRNSPTAAAANTMQLAIASRTTKTTWAQKLLDDFEIEPGVSLRSMFTQQANNIMIQIRPGSKKEHFAQLRSATGFAYSEMLFIDDDERMNLREISSQLGVLCVHTPQGITVKHFLRALQRYSALKEEEAAAAQTDGSSRHSHWMGYILNSENLGIDDDLPRGPVAAVAETLQGRVKFYSVTKKFGFVVDTASGREFFVHESKIPSGLVLQAGDEVTFESLQRNGGGGNAGRPSAVILVSSSSSAAASKRRNASAPPSNETRMNGTTAYASVSRSATATASKAGTSRGGAVVFASATTATSSTTTVAPSTSAASTSSPSSSSPLASATITMPCFTMSQPFAALLLNGVKTVESRNNPMFQSIKPGTRLLLHVGKRDWHDVESFRDILAKDDDDNKYLVKTVIDRVSRLPRGFRKGSIAGIITVGKTWQASDAERQHDATLQRKVLARGTDGIGRFCTEIAAAHWLKRPFVIARGNAGIYNVDIPKDCLPDQL
jgi:magnesium-dependent phosphatase 1